MTRPLTHQIIGHGTFFCKLFVNLHKPQILHPWNQCKETVINTFCLLAARDNTGIVPGRRWAVEIKIKDEFEDGCRPSDGAGIWEPLALHFTPVGRHLFQVNQVVRAAGIAFGFCQHNSITTVQDVVRKPSWKQGCVSSPNTFFCHWPTSVVLKTSCVGLPKK